ncbi:MAG: YbaB/EbfC family nucleoid-associated protein [Oscillospiraceae bacterium]
MAKGGFPKGMGGMGGGNMNQMIKQAQKMQEQMAQMQEDLENKVYTATAGGGAVTATISGKKELKEITLNPDVVDPDDIEMLQDLIVAAVNEGLRKAEADSTEQMSSMTGGLKIPGLF